MGTVLLLRIYASPENSADRALYFEPYMKLVRHLCGVWDKLLR